ncbi:MAG: hypothetical protein IPJ78_18865 [Gemmatimonadetes bacterium]|nr:hypothetical protein [Gemmatimonadota bacterium]
MNPPPSPSDLVTEWRTRARTLERIGDPNCARLWTLAADELAAAKDVEAALTQREAAKRTGYTADHLAALINRRVIPNAGRSGAPRIRVADLPPRKRRMVRAVHRALATSARCPLKAGNSTLTPTTDAPFGTIQWCAGATKAARSTSTCCRSMQRARGIVGVAEAGHALAGGICVPVHR